MALNISIDWATYTINIPRTSLLLLQSNPIEVRQLDLTEFHEALRDLEDDALGMPQPVTHNYSGSTSISGVILAQVIEVLDPYTITFEDGQYAVNVVGGNSNVADKVNINNVGVRTANSAGLQDLTSLQAASFSEGSVAVNISSSYAGTIFPIGTRGYPVNNLADAHTIAVERGMKRFVVIGDLTIGSGIFSDGYVFAGDNPNDTTITILDAAEVSNATFTNATVTGVLDNNNVVRDCIVTGLTHINGYLYDSAIVGGITLGEGTTCIMANCFAGTADVAEGAYPYITWPTGVHCDLVINNYVGNLGLAGCDVGTVEASVHLTSGHLHIESDLAAGTFHIHGDALLEYEAGYTATVLDETFKTRFTQIPVNVWDQNTDAHNLEGTFGHYVRYLQYLVKNVFVDMDAPVNGDGSQDNPFNNITDAMDKAEEDHASTLIIAGDVILDRNVKNITIQGVGLPEFDANGFDLKGVRLYQVKFKGAYTSSVIAQECNLLNGAYLDGYFENCGLSGDLICNASTSVLMKDCASMIAGTSRPTISMNSGGWTQLSVRGYSGGLTIKDADNALDRVTVELLAGSLTFDATNTAGIMVARGTGKFVDETTGATVVDETINLASIPEAVWSYTQ